MTEESIKRQFSRLLDQIVSEEQSFHRRLSAMRLDQSSLEQQHERLVAYYGEKHNHVRLKELHEAMFKVHRKIRSEHERAIHLSMSLGSKVLADMLPEPLIRAELEQLELLLSQMRSDHELLERERKQILTEHEACVRQLNSTA
ncbi:MAG: hypothetical protein AB1644_11105 [Candidatus Zixiibacteriota bacterium]